jgi:phosphoglycerol transferase MdoB-like AlkP superfamily enzyme
VVTTYLQQLLILIKRLSACYLIYLLCRLLFYFANRNYFPHTGFSGLLEDCFYGLRFDSFSIVVSNSFFILLSLLPVNSFYKPNYQKLLFWLFVIANAVFIAFNCIDVAYFPFIKKRSNADLFEQMGGQSDLVKLLPRFLLDFWWAFLVYILMIILLIFIYRRVKIEADKPYVPSGIKQRSLVFLLFILGAGLAVLGVRGGIQRIPIGIVNAGSAAGPRDAPLVLNTPFTLIKSVNEKAIPEYHFYTEDQLKQIYQPFHHFKDSVFRKQNVVVLILESFSKEYTKLGRTRSVTPFLDSLMDKSLLFTNAFSNGTKSIEGIPAILSGVPSYMDSPFVNSLYANNDQTSLAYLLNREGYETAFFHGGINGTMNFDSWAPQAGYKHYYGKNEYNNDADFDHYWGIWDEPFLQYCVKKMSGFKQPFHSAIFTLSSHHPYLVPDKYKNKFPKTDLENAESLGYADHSLRLFFEAAKKTDWYRNTVFVLTADHVGISNNRFFANPVGCLTIPVLFFKPDNSLAGIHENAFSQMDILPSTLNLLGYNKPFFAFGQTYKIPQQHPAYFYINGVYYQYGDSMTCFFRDQKLTHVYNYRRDSLLKNNLIGSDPRSDSAALSRFRAFLQTYNHTLLHNSGRLE